MNAKQVLNKIMTLLAKDEEKLTYAKLADGTIVESPTFDVGEDLMVIGEDGVKSPAPDGFHDLKLEGEEGEEIYIKVKTEDGKIVERENVEFEAVTEEVKDLPQSNIKEEANEVEDIDSPASNDKGLKPSSMMAAENIPQVGDGIPADIKEGEDTPMTMADMEKKMEDMAYRIEEMEKKMTEMMEVKEEVVDKDADIEELEDEEEEEELAKLDGAPVETVNKFSAEKSKNIFGKKAVNSQSAFLSKLYK